MTVIYVLIPIAVLLTIIGIYLFFWAVKSEQFDDLEKEGMSILYDEDKQASNDTTKPTENTPKDPHEL
ncbi:cbb3-type cytochrome oxidase assembly protein CcoS [Thalassotalea sp. LPB0316]|uniref:cbb3-type cytochrome oxidase assembly protein CcoS n=1 Tax=Thalassotalea sp. LPB0316 TaxID=2769490 RepID=UPI0018686BB7|nr:cbb3-type cytochrome oxidase assembly protein CcoS [Thalassotalea sp. LPB0316]QOL25047.1 cbb3-type cytochrome oxidase assembly protein CcoS [Thalassotalea sp. LPB0316]